MNQNSKILINKILHLTLRSAIFIFALQIVSIELFHKSDSHYSFTEETNETDSEDEEQKELDLFFVLLKSKKANSNQVSEQNSKRNAFLSNLFFEIPKPPPDL